MKSTQQKRSIPRRIRRFLLRLFFGLFLLICLICAFVLTHLKPLLLNLVRERYPDIIINIESVKFRPPLSIIAKGVYLQHVEDTSAASAIRIPELDLSLRYDFSRRQLSVSNLTISNYSMTMDRSDPGSILPLLAFSAVGPGSKADSIEGASAGFGMPVDEVRIKDGMLSIVGLNYDVRMMLNISLRSSVKKDEGYDISGSLKEFKAISYNFRTKPLYMEFETYLPSLSFEKPIDVGNMRVWVNNIPADLTGRITSVAAGYKVVADVSLDCRPVRELLSLLEYKVPVISDFDIASPAQIKAKVVYDPMIEEFIIVTGTASVDKGTASSEYYGIDVEGLHAFLPFKYIGTMKSYLWVIGGNIPEYGVGTLSADGVKYGRYGAEKLKSNFVYDGTLTQFTSLSAAAYGGKINGNVSVLYGTEAVETKLRFDADDLEMAKVLETYPQKKFNITGKASGTAELELTGSYIENINVRMKTEDGIFEVEDIGKSLAALPGGEAVTQELKKKMGKPEYWEEFVKALRNYPYDNGRIDVTWDSRDEGSVQLDLWLKGKKPKAGTVVSFPTVPITVTYHGISALTDLFNIDKILSRENQNK